MGPDLDRRAVILKLNLEIGIEGGGRDFLGWGRGSLTVYVQDISGLKMAYSGQMVSSRCTGLVSGGLWVFSENITP